MINSSTKNVESFIQRWKAERNHARNWELPTNGTKNIDEIMSQTKTDFKMSMNDFEALDSIINKYEEYERSKADRFGR